MAAVAEQTRTMAAQALDDFASRLVVLPEPVDERLLAREPRTEHERWVQQRVVCDFCRDDYKPNEPLWVKVGIPCSYVGKIICAACVGEIGFTGCHWHQSSRTFGSYIVSIFGRDEPPDDWGYERPSWPDVLAALRYGSDAYATRLLAAY